MGDDDRAGIQRSGQAPNPRTRRQRPEPQRAECVTRMLRTPRQRLSAGWHNRLLQKLTLKS